MTAWAIFYLVCFLVGVTLTVLSFLGGSLQGRHGRTGFGGDARVLGIGQQMEFAIGCFELQIMAAAAARKAFQ